MEITYDWCISRQLWWGHRIPAWYRGDEIYVGMEEPKGEGWVSERTVFTKRISLLTSEGRNTFVTCIMGCKGNGGKTVVSRLSEGHYGKEGAVHHRDTYIFEFLTRIAQDDLTKFIFDPEHLIRADL